MGATKEEAAATRQRLIDVAIGLLRTRGPNSFTLDLVAKESGVSKGGLLHHFPSKNALIEEVLHYLIHDFDARACALYEAQPAQSGGWLRAYILATFDDSNLDTALPIEVAAMLFTALSEQTVLQKLIQEDAQHWHERLTSDGVTPARAMLIRHAADAYWMDRMFAPLSYDDELRKAFIAELIQLTEVP